MLPRPAPVFKAFAPLTIKLPLASINKFCVPLVEMASWSAPGENIPVFGSESMASDGSKAVPLAIMPDVKVAVVPVSEVNVPVGAMTVVPETCVVKTPDTKLAVIPVTVVPDKVTKLAVVPVTVVPDKVTKLAVVPVTVVPETVVKLAVVPVTVVPDKVTKLAVVPVTVVPVTVVKPAVPPVIASPLNKVVTLIF